MPDRTRLTRPTGTAARRSGSPEPAARKGESGLDRLLELQHAAGNAAVGQLVAQRQGPGSAPVPGPGPTTVPPAGQPAPAGPAAVPAKPALDPVEAALARIDKLDPAIKDHAYLDTRAKRLQFLAYMRPFFGSDEATLDHFAKIEDAAIPGSTTLMHEAAGRRLRAVAEEMGATMPRSSGIGWAFRKDFEKGTQDIADLHRIGMAIDFNATEMPHLGRRGEVKDPRQKDLIAVVTKRSAAMNLGVSEEKLGKLLREAGEASLSDKEADKEVLKRADVVALLATVRSESEALEKASADFQASLGGKAAELVQLQKDYFAETDPKKKAELMAKLPEIVKPWLTELEAVMKAKKDEIEQAERAPGENYVMADLPVGAAAADARTATDKVRKAVGESLVALRAKRLGKSAMSQGRKRIDAARKHLGEAAWQPPPPSPAPAPAPAAVPAPAPVAEPASKPAAKPVRRKGRPPPAPPPDPTPLIAELERLAGLLGTRSEVMGKKHWHDRVAAVHTGLTTDVGFVLGRAAGPKSRSPKVETGLPPLAQLVEKGFFTTRSRSKSKAAFDVDFVVSMARHGFHPGARFDNPDAMHFELPWKGGR